MERLFLLKRDWGVHLPSLFSAAIIFAMAHSTAHAKTAGTGSFSNEIRSYKGVLSILSWEMKYEGNHKGSVKCDPAKPMDVEVVFNPDGSISGSSGYFYVFLKESPKAKAGAECEFEFMDRSAAVEGSHNPDGSFQMTLNDDTYSGVLDEKKIQLTGEFKKSTTMISDYLMGKIHHKYKLEIILIRMNGR